MPSYKRQSSRRFGRRKVLQATSLLPLAAQLPSLSRASDDVLFLYNWDDYISEPVLDQFAEQTGAKVKMDLFADGDEQFAKLRSGRTGYDVTVPTHDNLERMISADLLMPLDHALIPNLANLFELHRNPPYDPGNKHSIPYMWGSVGLAYRKSAFERPPDSWTDVFTPEGVERTGRVAWLSEASSIVPVASLMLGGSVNDLSDGNLDSIFALLRETKPLIRKIAGDNGQDLLAAGEVDVAIEWNGDIAALMMEDPDIGFAFPKEGSLYYVDCMCILADSDRPELAHAFLNHILQADVGRDLAEHIAYATPNEAAFQKTSAEYRSNPVIFPPRDISLHTNNYPGEEALDRLYRHWELLLAG